MFSPGAKNKIELQINSFKLVVRRIDSDIDYNNVADKLRQMPENLFWGVKMILVDRIPILAQRGILATMNGDTLFISSLVEDSEELLQAILHETAHLLLKKFSNDILQNDQIKNEFLRKRETLYHKLESLYQDSNLHINFYKNVEYNKDFDSFLVSTVGYQRLESFITGIFVSPYAATSIEEYWARTFEEYFSFDSNRKSTVERYYPAVAEIIKTITSGA